MNLEHATHHLEPEKLLQNASIHLKQPGLHDPEAKELEDALSQQQERLIQRIKNDPQLKKEFLSEYENFLNRKKENPEMKEFLFYYEFFDEELNAHIHIEFWGSEEPGEIFANPFSADYYQHLLKAEARSDVIFSRENVKQDAEGHPFFIPGELAEKLFIPEKNDFSAQLDFDPTKITDAIGKGIDGRIMELVRLLNNLGLQTDQTCQGHSEDQKPYLRFEADQADAVLGLLRAWEKFSAIKYIIRPIGGFPSGFTVEPSEGTSLKEAQKYLDAFTDFLHERIDKKDYKRSPTEFIHHIRRRALRAISQ